jgi:acetoacetyl-CoA synthetase
VFRHVDAASAAAAGLSAMLSHGERSLQRDDPACELGWPAPRQQVASLALHLRAQGVQPVGRVAAYVPNIHETMVASEAIAVLRSRRHIAGGLPTARLKARANAASEA